MRWQACRIAYPLMCVDKLPRCGFADLWCAVLRSVLCCAVLRVLKRRLRVEPEYLKGFGNSLWHLKSLELSKNRSLVDVSYLSPLPPSLTSFTFMGDPCSRDTERLDFSPALEMGEVQDGANSSLQCLEVSKVALNKPSVLGR